MEEQTQVQNEQIEQNQQPLNPLVELEFMKYQLENIKLDVDNWKFIINNTSFDSRVKQMAKDLLINYAFRMMKQELQETKQASPKLEIVKS